MYANNRTRRKWNQVLLFLVSCHFVKYSISSPIFSSQFSQFQAARNIRNLPCVVRKSGLRGVCMFAIDCIKSNGTHLGTCIDKFYFGSCCQMKLQDVDSIYNPEISDNRIDTSFPASSSYNTNSISDKPFIPVSSSTSSSTSVSQIASNYKTTSKPAISYNNETFELIPSSKSPSTTEQYTVNVGGFTTTLGTIVEKNVTTSISLKDELPTTTEGIKLTTFQSIQDTKRPANLSTSPTATTMIRITTKQPTSSTLSRTKKPIPTTTKKPITIQSINRTDAARPTSRRPVTTIKPTKNATATVIKTTRKPVASTNVTVNRRTTTITSRRNATITTRKSTPSVSTSTSIPTTSPMLTTVSFVETTKAPRPKPTPTDFIVKVEPSTLSAEDMLVTTFSVESVEKTTSPKPSSSSVKPAVSTSTVKSSVNTRRTTTTNRPTTVTSNKKPITEQTTTSSTSSSSSPMVKTTSKPLNSITTEQETEIPTTSAPGIVTWTLANDSVENSTKDDSWILMQSITPDDVKETTESIFETTTEEKTFSSTPLITLTTLSDNITNEIPAGEEEASTEKIRETTNSEEETEDSSEYIGVTGSSSEYPLESEEEVGEDDEEEETTTFSPEADSTNSNLTLSTLTPSEYSTTSPASVSLSSSTTTEKLSPDESKPAINSEETTMWPVTQRTNDTSEAASSIDTATDENISRFNESTTAAYQTSSAASFEGVDYKTICGKRMFPEPRIVGGSKAAFGRWPWQISLRQWRTSTYLHKCGSALLNENWAISAAHCVDNVPPSDLLLRLGEYDLSIEEEPYGYQERRVQIVASHPQFDPRTFEYDLALLRFYEPVIFQPNIIPVCVPDIDEDFIGRTAYVTGWGRLYEDGPLPSVLQEVTVPVIRNDICESMYRNAGYIEHIPHIFICAGHKQGSRDSCEGDSGGPMVIQRTDKRFQLAGIISWGIGCAEPNQPGVYTRISEFRDWINQILMF